MDFYEWWIFIEGFCACEGIFVVVILIIFKLIIFIYRISMKFDFFELFNRENSLNKFFLKILLKNSQFLSQKSSNLM